MNAITEQLWPHIEAASCKMLMHGGFLETMLNSTTFWRPPMLAGATVTVQAVVLGQSPPRVTGVKAFPKRTTNGAQTEASAAHPRWLHHYGTGFAAMSQPLAACCLSHACLVHPT